MRHYNCILDKKRFFRVFLEQFLLLRILEVEPDHIQANHNLCVVEVSRRPNQGSMSQIIKGEGHFDVCVCKVQGAFDSLNWARSLIFFIRQLMHCTTLSSHFF